jgi:hypothetical protein
MKDARTDVNAAQSALKGGGFRADTPREEADLRSIHRECERSGPFVGFFLQRPLEKKKARDALPHSRREAEREWVESREHVRKAEAEAINGTTQFYLQSTGLTSSRVVVAQAGPGPSYEAPTSLSGEVVAANEDLRVLLIEEREAARNALSKQMRSHGYSPVTPKAGASAHATPATPAGSSGPKAKRISWTK